MRYVMLCLLVSLPLALSSCSTWDKLNKTEKGAVIGGTGGALIGSEVGEGAGGAILGGAAGAAGGGLIGHEIDDDDDDDIDFD